MFYESSKFKVSWLSSVSRTIMCLQVQPRVQIYCWYNHFLSPRWTLGAVHRHCVWRYIFFVLVKRQYSKQNFSSALNNDDGSFFPPLITNGRLAPDCSRQIGTSCSFTCDDSYKASILPRSITCSSDAVWNKDVDELCIRESIWFIHYAMHKINSLLIFVQFIFLILIWNSYIYFFKFLFLQ